MAASTHKNIEFNSKYGYLIHQFSQAGSNSGGSGIVRKTMYAVIMAGGKGTRFWPRSREKKPKHLLKIFSGKSILRETFDRIKALVPEDNIYVVTGRGHANEVSRQIPEIPAAHLLVEPVGRNTAPCIGLAALHVCKTDPDGVMAVFPSDHFIRHEKEFIRILSIAAQIAERRGALVTVGVTPTGPETGYGYVEKGDLLTRLKKEDIYRAKSFREKPDLTKAKAFIRSGRFLWNSGIFLWKASTILDAIKVFLPELHEGLLEIEEALDTRKERDVLKKVYRRIKPVSIDYGVMEKSREVLLVRGDFGWSDVGNWDALWELLEKDEEGNVIIGQGIAVNSRKSFVYSPDKMVSLIDVEDLIVVETKDSVLICKRGLSQDVRKIVDILERQKLRKYL
jgi:mannose-1-phosphate guanylyltransferase